MSSDQSLLMSHMKGKFDICSTFSNVVFLHYVTYVTPCYVAVHYRSTRTDKRYVTIRCSFFRRVTWWWKTGIRMVITKWHRHSVQRALISRYPTQNDSETIFPLYRPGPTISACWFDNPNGCSGFSWVQITITIPWRRRITQIRRRRLPRHANPHHTKEIDNATCHSPVVHRSQRTVCIQARF